MTRAEDFETMDDGRTVYSDVCTYCIHSRGFPSGSCKAFPAENGIPDEIWNGKNPHTKPFTGDHGYLFKKA